MPTSKEQKKFDKLVNEVQKLHLEAEKIYNKVCNSLSLEELQNAIVAIAKKGEKLTKQDERLLQTPEMKAILNWLQLLSNARDTILFSTNFEEILKNGEELLQNTLNERKNREETQTYIFRIDQMLINIKDLLEYPSFIVGDKKDRLDDLYSKLDNVAQKLLSSLP